MVGHWVAPYIGRKRADAHADDDDDADEPGQHCIYRAQTG